MLDFSQSSTTITPDEIELLSDIARETALDVAGSRYDIITRESLLDLLKSHGKTLEKCIGECETKTGRLIGANVGGWGGGVAVRLDNRRVLRRLYRGIRRGRTERIFEAAGVAE